MLRSCFSVRIFRISKRSYHINKRTRINEHIRARELRVINSDGSQLGVISRDEALRAAKEADLDLVEISPSANPPVAKIVDWGKYSYQKEKQQQKNRKKSKSGELKQMRFGLKIGDHDIDVKLRKVRKFLDNGSKVRLTVVLRGREMAHKDLAFVLAERLLSLLGEEVAVDQKPSMSGRQLNMVIRSTQHAKS